MRIIVLFLVGFVLDVLATLDMQAVNKNKPLKSGIYTFVLTVLNYGALANIIVNQNIWIEILVYGLGGAIGAYLTIWWNR